MRRLNGKRSSLTWCSGLKSSSFENRAHWYVGIVISDFAGSAAAAAAPAAQVPLARGGLRVRPHFAGPSVSSGGVCE